MQFGATVLYVDDVSAVVDFYRRAFDLEVRFWDEALGFAELETGGTVLATFRRKNGCFEKPGTSRTGTGCPRGVFSPF